MNYTYKLVYHPTNVNNFQIEARDPVGNLQGYLAAIISQKEWENRYQSEFKLQKNQFFAKTYSENADWVPQLLKPPYFERTGAVLTKHFPSHIVDFPIVSMTPQFIADQFELTYNRQHDLYEAEPFLWALYDEFVAPKSKANNA